MPRVFIAVGLPSTVRERVGWMRERLGGPGAPVKWVDPAQAHVTLRFLGEVPEERLDALKAAMHEVALGTEPFTVSFQGAGAFGPPGRPRILWLGVASGAAELGRLQARLEERLLAVGFPHEEREFTAHVTVGRVRDDASTAALFRLSRDLGVLKVGSLGGHTVKHIDLMDSTTTRTGPIYKRLERVALGAR